MTNPRARKKLIEVAFPLDAINKEALRRKQKAPKGWPASFHKWWSQKPLAAARAVVFAQMVDDPSTYLDSLREDPELKRSAEAALKERLSLWEESHEIARKAMGTGLPLPSPGPQPTLDGVLADMERERLFRIIEDLVLWDNTGNEAVLRAARDEIWRSWRRACAEHADHPQARGLFDPNALPAFYDPFAGSGSLPLSAQWLGLESYASDLNPVAVLINKAMIEIPPRFAGRAPVNPVAREEKSLIAREWRDAQGLADDVRHYGQWMRDEAEERIGHLYPKIAITAEMAKDRLDLRAYVGRRLTVVAWLWARTVKSPNPAFAKVDVPLTSTYVFSTKAGREAYVEPVIDDDGYHFTVKVGKPKDASAAKAGTSAGRRAAFRCLLSGTPLTYEYIRTEGQAGRLGARLMAIVAEGDRGRVYLAPTPEHEAAALKAHPEWRPEVALPDNPRDFKTPNYGLMTFADLFTPRQLEALTTFSDLVQEAAERARLDAVAAGLSDDGCSLNAGGSGAQAYADAVAVYLSCVVDRMAYYGSSLSTWLPKDNALRDSMPRQALAMTWEFAEGNPLGKSSGDVTTCAGAVSNYLDIARPNAAGFAKQAGAQALELQDRKFVVSTDPPYYDNIGYAELSDFFYVWLRRQLRRAFPELLSTVAVPKEDELVATPYRHGGKANAESFFLAGMTQAMHRLAEQSHPAFPLTIYYAFKQTETESDVGTASTGWETFLGALIGAGFSITGTWPLRTEGTGRLLAKESNALASSIVLVCRPRAASSPSATRREFVTALKSELPVAVAHLQRNNIAPVDLAQAAIGPGMAVYTRYAKVIDAEGKHLRVREALALINQILDETLAEQEGDFDSDTRWALTWFEQQGFAEGEYGTAETLATARNTSVSGLVEAGIALSARGKVRLLAPAELSKAWDPTTDRRLTHWDAVHHLIRVLEADGEPAAADLIRKLGSMAETARELAYRLYTISERKNRAKEALAYNGLVQSWPEMLRLAQSEPRPSTRTTPLFGEA